MTVVLTILLASNRVSVTITISYDIWYRGKEELRNPDYDEIWVVFLMLLKIHRINKTDDLLKNIKQAKTDEIYSVPHYLFIWRRTVETGMIRIQHR